MYKRIGVRRAKREKGYIDRDICMCVGQALIGRAYIGRALIGRAYMGRAYIGQALIGRALIGRAYIRWGYPLTPIQGIIMVSSGYMPKA